MYLCDPDGGSGLQLRIHERSTPEVSARVDFQKFIILFFKRKITIFATLLENREFGNGLRYDESNGKNVSGIR